MREWREKNWGKEQIISQLRSEIEQKEWEIKNIGGTPLHEQELQSKKEELARLEAQLNAEKQFNWTPWIGLGITFTVIVGISTYLLVKEKLRKNRSLLDS